MGLIFWIIIGIILGIFILTTLWIFFNFLKNSKRDYNLYKSVYKSVFSRKLSLYIIIIFYLISFGLVGGLTSTIGRLNSEVTSYIKDNHLHQGVIQQTSYNKNTPTDDTLDQKSFYLATQGVLDFYNEKDQNCLEEINFIDMLGGQKIKNGIIIKNGNPTTKERLDGSTSPLSIRANDYNSKTYQTYSMMDISAFWNFWYDNTSFTGNEEWLIYSYNGEPQSYEDTFEVSHNESGAITWVEQKMNKFIFNPTIDLDSNDSNYWTFEKTIDDENNGWNSFSSVAYNIFDRDLNKYYSTLTTYIFEYYLTEFDENDQFANQFASSRVFEYQNHVYNTDFLLQSYNKNQAYDKNKSTSENTFLDNSGKDNHGVYSIDTMKFYNNTGQEVKGPSSSDENDEFFEPHLGTKDDPYQVYLLEEYYEANNWESKTNESIKLHKHGFYYEVLGSYHSPTYSFPIQTFSSSFQNPKDNATILISTQSLLRLTRKPSVSTTNYEFFGFSNVYNKTQKATDWYFSGDSKKTKNLSYTNSYQVNKYLNYINSFFGDSGWDNDESTIENKPQDFYLNGETINEMGSLISFRSYTIIQEIHGDKIFFMVIMGIFLSITLIVLTLLIRKRISDSNKQMGTIKALGFDPSRIATAYTIFPIIIIILGSILAIMVALPLSLFFASLYGSFYSINLSGVYVGFTLWLKVFIIPLLFSMFIAYWMAYYTIRKPTLDLLNNVNNDKPNWLVRGTSYLIPTFASFGFTYKFKGIGRAFFKSLLLFFAIMGSMSITSFAFASSTMTKTMTKQVFDIINYDSKSIEFGAPFVEDININDVNENYEFKNNTKMRAFDLFPDLEPNGELIYYVTMVFFEPERALFKFQELLDPVYPDFNSFDFTFEISYDENGSPIVTSNYYIDWKTAVALWTTNIALHVPIDNDEDGKKDDENPDLTTSIYEGGEISFQMLDPLLHDYAVNLVANIVTRYGTESTFTFLHFFNKIINDFNGCMGNLECSDLKEDLGIITDWFQKQDIRKLKDYLLIALEEEYIFNDIVFNKNYYDGPDSSNGGEISQTITTSFSSYSLKTDLSGNLIWTNDQTKFKNASTYMEGYTSIDELMITNDVGPVAEKHIRASKYGENETDTVVNVAMTKAQFKELQHYKEATPLLNQDLSSSAQVRVLANTKVWNNEENSYQTAYVPVVLDVEVYDSIFPLGTFFLQADMDDAISKSLAQVSNVDESTINDLWGNESWYQGYSDFINSQLALSNVASYNPNYSVTYNIDTTGNENFRTTPFSVSLGQQELSTLINDGNRNKDPLEVSLIFLVNNYYAPFSIPLSINTIVSQGSRVYELLQGILYIIAFFSLFIGITVVMIAMKDIMDSNKREVSMFKAFGYSNGRATSLVITPYLFVIVLAFLIAIPTSLIFLSTVGAILTVLTGTTYVFTLVLWQWAVVMGFIIGLIVFLGFVGYKSYQHTNPLEAINETN